MRSARICEQLLAEPELTLQKIESAMAEAKAITCGMSTSFQDVNTIPARTRAGQYRRDPIHRDTSNEPANPKFSQARQVRRESTCYRCGSAMHFANYPRCPAKDVNCRQCGKSGHFAKVRRSKDHKYQVREVTVPDVTVLSINTQASEQIRGNLFCDTLVFAHLMDRHAQLNCWWTQVQFPYFQSLRTWSISSKNALLAEPKLHLVTY